MNGVFQFVERELGQLQATVRDLGARASVGGVPYEELSDTVKRTREQRNESLRDVGKVAGISWQAIYRIEHGKPVTPRQLTGLAKWLRLPIVFPP